MSLLFAQIVLLIFYCITKLSATNYQHFLFLKKSMHSNQEKAIFLLYTNTGTKFSIFKNLIHEY